jgi:hypothetical protein
MEGKIENQDNLNSGNLIVFFYKWRKPLLMMTTLAAVVSIVVSLMIQNKYKSTVVLFPTTTSSIAKALISENNTGKEDVLRLGEEEQAEQMLQILNSDEIRNRIIEKYNLLSHYDIDEDDEYQYTKLQKEYESNVTFDRTKFMSVEINVLDHDPDTAALIANDIAALLDTVKNRMRREIAVEALAIVKDEFDSQIAYIQELEDSMKTLREMGIINIRAQSERLTEQLGIAMLKNNQHAVKQLQEKLDTIGKYAGIFTSIEDEKVLEKKRLSVIRSKYREAEIDAEKTLQHKFVVNNAFPAEKKTYPIRWLIVVISTLSTFLLTLVLILFYESVKSANLK